MTKQEETTKREEERLKDMKWSIQGIWNDNLNLTKRREPKVRDYISPSDLGKNYWERYQKMMGVPEERQFEDRVLRIFSAGDEFHNLLKNVFKACGIFINSQDDSGWSIIEPTKNHLKMLGKYDVLAGGKPNHDKAKQLCEQMEFSDFVKERTLLMVEKLIEKYPNGLPELIYEVKSINSMAFLHKKGYLQEAYPWHTLQCYAYIKANNIQEGRVLYISKDDLITAEFPVFLNDKKLVEKYDKDMTEMSEFIRKKQEPPKPDNVVFNKRGKIRFQKNKEKYVITGCYEKNWEIERSMWPKRLTGFKNLEDWVGSIKGEIKDKNDEIKANYIKNKGL